MTDTEIEYRFWFLSNKLIAIITMLSALVESKLTLEEIEYLKQEIRGTNDEKGLWTTYQLNGKLKNISLSLAYDGEEGNDMIHIRIITSADLKPKLEALDLFQALFKNLEVSDF
ncbi:hypothetical protein GOQ30_12465 [Flavobacterium sp. TP390]|uniref:Uncharacterized protein n=1 Tax=Flavobacterium profundi TaxID=1774945 RepID=A0A6I4ISZ7_9FLAO|nr:hypothetical protein [Flavobacterium profundi]MVO09976.1 hypothetical protein [Flavobacterium profundi]